MKRRSLCGFGKAEGEVNKRSVWEVMAGSFLDQVVGRDKVGLSFWAVNFYQPLGRIF
jgi:hypothetical protein